MRITSYQRRLNSGLKAQQRHAVPEVTDGPFQWWSVQPYSPRMLAAQRRRERRHMRLVARGKRSPGKPCIAVPCPEFQDVEIYVFKY